MTANTKTPFPPLVFLKSGARCLSVKAVCVAAHLNLDTLDTDGILGMDGILGKLVVSLFTSSGFFFAMKIRTMSRNTTASVTPMAIPTEAGTWTRRRQLVN